MCAARTYPSNLMNAYATNSCRPKDAKQLARVTLDGRPCILKICDSDELTARQAKIMSAVSHTGYAPLVYRVEGNSLWYESVSGDSFDEKFRMATAADDADTLRSLASRLAIFLQMFHSFTQGNILAQPDFCDFVLRDDRCVCIRFDNVCPGLPYTDVAGIVACALTRSVGDFYAAFPFIRRFLECFHLSVIDIINEVSQQLDRFMYHDIADKNILLDALVRAQDHDDWHPYSN